MMMFTYLGAVWRISRRNFDRFVAECRRTDAIPDPAEFGAREVGRYRTLEALIDEAD
jgi:hypothetical protein